MDNLTESILYRAHLRPGTKDLRIQKFSVREAIDNAIKSQASLLIAARVCVEIAGNFAAYSDPGAVCFMIKQLLSNAAKHCPGCCVKITASNGAINVEDNGPGIPPHDLRRVTERGFTHAEGGKMCIRDRMQASASIATIVRARNFFMPSPPFILGAPLARPGAQEKTALPLAQRIFYLALLWYI